MGRTKLAVRAQRKFAHKVFIPNVSDNKCDIPIERREQENVAAPPILVNNPISVHDLLNQVAFRNIHAHVDEQVPDPIKDVRIVLKRLPPIRNGTPNKPNANQAAEDNGSETSPLSSPNQKSEESKRLSNSARPSIPIAHSSRKARPIQTKSQPRLKKVFLRGPKPLPKPRAIKTMKQMKLRNRTISRKLLNAKQIQKVIQTKRTVTKTERRVSLSSRRASETSVEDNRPLMYFVSNKVSVNNSKPAHNTERQKHTRTMSVRKGLITLSTRTSRSLTVPSVKNSTLAQKKSSKSMLKKKSLTVIKKKAVVLPRKTKECKVEIESIPKLSAKRVNKTATPQRKDQLQKRVTRFSDGTIPKQKQEVQSPLSSPPKSSDGVETKRGPPRKTSRDSAAKAVENVDISNTAPTKAKEPKLLLKPIDKIPEKLNVKTLETSSVRPSTSLGKRRNVIPQPRVTTNDAVHGNGYTDLESVASDRSDKTNGALERVKQWLVNVRPEPSPVIPEPSNIIPKPSTPKSSSVVPKPSSVIPKSSPVVAKSSPVVPKSSPVVPKSSPVVPKPGSVLPKSSPVVPKSSPVVPKPSSVLPKSNPVASKPSALSPKPVSAVPKIKKELSVSKPIKKTQGKTFTPKVTPKPVQVTRKTSKNGKSVLSDVVTVSTESEFKVPKTPRKRTLRPVQSAATTTSGPRITPRERNLRKRCTAWNYKRLSCLTSKPETIRRFCTECTRCRLLFKPGNSVQVDATHQHSVASRSRSASDVYEFEERDDDSRNIAPYTATRGSRADDNQSSSEDSNPIRSALMHISKQTNHVDKLNELMTKKGKKFLRAASIMNSNPDGDQPRDDTVLAKVITILMETDVEEKEPIQSPTPSPVDVAILEPKPGSSRRLSGEAEMPRKRTRNSNQNPTVQPESVPLQVCQKFCPTETEFTEDPAKYAAQILQMHPGTGLCGIKPPQSFTPSCVINNSETPFKMNNQYVHRMYQRWGPATKELTVIRSVQNTKVQGCPLFDGLEVDLAKLHKMVQEANGIEALQADNQKWTAIMHKLGFRSSTKPNKLQSIYYKCLLDYDTLTCEKIDIRIIELEKCWAKREAQAIARAKDPLWRQKKMKAGMSLDDDDAPTHLETVCAEAEECVAPGKNGTIKSFKKIANVVQEMYFPNRSSPTVDEVEREFWTIVLSATPHVCVHSASVDTSTHDCGFTADKSEPYANHPWNLKRLSTSSSNLLSYLGPMPGVSSTTLHFGMAFTTSCWHMDPTAVPYIEYLHSGPPKIWYSISADQAEKFRTAAETLCPAAVQNKDIWLPCDILMIPPKILQQQGIKVSRHVQHAGEYVIVYPKSYCACIDTGYTISEGVYFAPHTWLNNAESIYLNLRSSCEPSLFPMEKLLISMATMQFDAVFLLQRVHTMLQSMLQAELAYRQKLAGRSIELMSPAVIGLTKGQTGLCAMHGVHLFEQTVMRGEQLTGVYCILLVSNAKINSIIDNLQQRIRRLCTPEKVWSRC